MSQIKTEDKYRNLERVNFWVTNCDAKASYLLAIQGIILTVIFTSKFSTYIISTLSYKFSMQDINWDSFLRFIEGLSLYSFFLLFFISLCNAYKTLRARLNPSVFNETGLTTNSVFFFETIANRKFVDFIQDQKNLTQEQIDDDIDSQVFINSKICKKKFKYYNMTIKYCSVGFIIGLIYLLLTIKNGS